MSVTNTISRTDNFVTNRPGIHSCTGSGVEGDNSLSAPVLHLMTRGSSDSSPASLPSFGNPAAGAAVFSFPSSESFSDASVV